MITLAELIARYPAMPWREPIKITIPGRTQGYACRICIAQKGLVAANYIPQSLDDVTLHIATEHPPE